jgi:hypothetical protein
MENVQVFILGRKSGIIQTMETCYDFIITKDYIGDGKSTFRLHTEWVANVGDFLIAKNGEEALNVNFAPFYAGVVNSIDNGQIVTKEIRNIFDFQFGSFEDSGSSIEDFYISILNEWVLNEPGDPFAMAMVEVIPGSTQTQFVYSPNEPPSIMEFQKYLVNMFQKYNVVFELAKIEIDTTKSAANYKFIFWSNAKSDKIQLKNNNFAFLNWSVYINQQALGEVNRLIIQDSSSSSTGTNSPSILGTYYIDQSGTIMTSITPNVLTPTKEKLILFDLDGYKEQNEGKEDDQGNLIPYEPPDYDAMAKTELSIPAYSHEIKFQLIKDNNILNSNNLVIGLLVDIYYLDNVGNSYQFKSVLTAYSISSNSNLISLTFGNVRSNLKYIMDNFSF